MRVGSVRPPLAIGILAASFALAQPQPAQDAGIIQGSIEQSNVRSVVEMSRMIEITRSYTQVAGILQQQGDMGQQSIDKLADIPN